MQISEITITTNHDKESNVKAVAGFTIGSLRIRLAKIILNTEDNTLFLAYPSIKHNGYHETVVFPLDGDVKQAIEIAVLRRYNKIIHG